MEGVDRPLDLLNKSKGKSIIVNLTNGKEYVGKLMAFDIHVNIILEDAKEIENGEQATNYGHVFFRGDSIVFISPSI